jgi:hypothetical protein
MKMTEQKPVVGVIINPDGTHDERLFKQPSDYQQAIDGWITAVRLYDYNGEEIACAYVDDEGLLKNLPLNPMASALSFLFGNTPHLVGNAVVVGKSDAEGYDTDLPEFILTLVRNISAKQESNA